MVQHVFSVFISKTSQIFLGIVAHKHKAFKGDKGSMNLNAGPVEEYVNTCKPWDLFKNYDWVSDDGYNNFKIWIA